MVQETTKGFPLMFQGAGIPIGAKICAAVLVVGAVGFTGSRMLSGGDETAVDANATNHKKLFVLSAGPNGRIETPANANAAAAISGDDIGFLVGQRR